MLGHDKFSHPLVSASRGRWPALPAKKNLVIQDSRNSGRKKEAGAGKVQGKEEEEDGHSISSYLYPRPPA